MNHIHLKSCLSTQSYLIENITDQDILVSCDIQTKARGRGHNKWDTFKGSLCFSFTTHHSDIKTLTSLEIGLLVSRFFNDNFKKNIQLKWPNDLILDSKKVGGILLSSTAEHLICGVGLNLFPLQDESFGKYKVKAGTIFESQQVLSKKEFAFSITEYIHKHRFISSELIRDEWNKSCFHFDLKIEIYDEKSSLSGIFKGINKDGAALIEVKQGNQVETREIYSGSLRIKN